MKKLLLALLVLVVALVALPPAYYALFPIDSPKLPPPGRKIPVSAGVAVNAITWGDSGSPIVLVHGLPGTAYDWAPLGVALGERGARVIAYDRVGYGYSDARANDAYTPEGNARDLLGLLESEDLHDVTVVGWSYGGPVAIIAARLDPSRIARLVLLGSGGPQDDPPDPPSMLALLGSRPVRAWLGAVPPASLGLQMALSVQAFSAQPMPDWWLPNLAANFAMPSMRRTYYAEGERFLESELGIEEVEQPILLLHGDDDRLAPVAIGFWLANHAQRARLQVIPQGSHMLPVTHAELLAKNIEAFAAGRIEITERATEQPGAR